MKIICPGHDCLLEDRDKQVLEHYHSHIEVIATPCPFCNEELLLLNILFGNVTYLRSGPVSQIIDTVT